MSMNEDDDDVVLQDPGGPPLPPGQHQGSAGVGGVDPGDLASPNTSGGRNNRIRHPSLHNDGGSDHHGQDRGERDSGNSCSPSVSNQV